MKKLYLSRYSKIFEKDGIYAYYHSLRMKPLYINKKMHEIIQELLNSEDFDLKTVTSSLTEKEFTQFQDTINVMVDYKILITDLSYDDKVIETIRKSLPEPYISVCYFIMTEFCNLACSYCFIENSMDEKVRARKIMSSKTVKDGLDFYCKQITRKPELFNQEKSIIIYGGEPLTNYDNVILLLQLIKEYKESGKLPKDLSVALLTNGTLLTDEMAKEIGKYDVSISISLDGATAQENKCRKYHNGNIAFDDIVRGINIAKQNNLDCGLSVTLTEDSLKDIDAMEKVVIESGLNSLGFNLLMTDENFKVSDTYNERASEFVIEAFDRFRKKGIYEDRMMRKVKAFAKSKLYLYDCAATGGNQMVIAPDGSIGCCHGYLYNREYFPSNIYDDNFDPAKDEQYLEWAGRTPINMPQCQDCPALGICGGGCALTAKKNNSSLYDLDERFCVHAKMTLEWMIWDLFSNMNQTEN